MQDEWTPTRSATRKRQPTHLPENPESDQGPHDLKEQALRKPTHEHPTITRMNTNICHTKPARARELPKPPNNTHTHSSQPQPPRG
eukprot:4093274-Alexandrium_andersonii.AAC.1